METIDVSLLEAIPHIDKSHLNGRFLSAMHFYHEGEWQMYFQSEGRLQSFKAWPAEAFYFAEAPEKNTDFLFHFLNYLAQRACYIGFEKPIMGLRDDMFNLSASIAKIEHLHSTKNMLNHGVTRMVATEIEYIYSVCRSMFDLIQEIASKMWNKITLRDEEAQQRRKNKKKLEETFSRIVFSGDEFRTTEQIVERFGLPNVWANYYAKHAPFFNQLREFRDNIIHRGSQVEMVLESEHGFLVRKRYKPFSEMKWLEEEEFEADVGLLMPALGHVILGTLRACDDFTLMIEDNFEMLPPIVPGMGFFMRGYFDKSFKNFLNAASERYFKLAQ